MSYNDVVKYLTNYQDIALHSDEHLKVDNTRKAHEGGKGYGNKQHHHGKGQEKPLRHKNSNTRTCEGSKSNWK